MSLSFSFSATLAAAFATTAAAGYVHRNQHDLVAGARADIVLLVKPQFEVGRTAVKGGLVTDPALRADAVHGVLWAAWDVGLRTAGIIASPIVGTHGNHEYVAWFSDARGTDPSEWESTVTRLTGSR